MSEIKEIIYLTNSDHQKLTELIKSMPLHSPIRTGLKDLEEELSRAEIVNAENIPNDIITMNSSFDLLDLDSGDKMSFSLVYPENMDSEAQKISIFSPIGTAVLGYKEGDVIEWKVPSRTRKLKIEKVHYQPEAAGDFHL